MDREELAIGENEELSMPKPTPPAYDHASVPLAYDLEIPRDYPWLTRIGYVGLFVAAVLAIVAVAKLVAMV